MDKAEATSILEKELAVYRTWPYEKLCALINCTETFERNSASGTVYQLELEVFFDDDSQTNLRVSMAIDDMKGWRAFIPLCNDLIMASDGTFIGE